MQFDVCDAVSDLSSTDVSRVVGARHDMTTRPGGLGVKRAGHAYIGTSSWVFRLGYITMISYSFNCEGPGHYAESGAEV